MRSTTRKGALRIGAASTLLALFAVACGSGDPGASPDPTGTGSDPVATGTATEPPVEGLPLGDPLVRQALSLAIDRPSIVEAIFNNTRLPADSFWAPSIPGYRDGACANLAFDPEQARTLWAEAGNPSGTLVLAYNADGGHAEWVEAAGNSITNELGDLGVTVQYNPVAEFGEYLELLDTEAFHNTLHRLGWGMDYPSPENYLRPINGTGGSSNHSGYANPEFDALVTAGDSAATLDEGLVSYQQAEDLLCRDLPIMPMFYGRNQFVHSERVSSVFVDAFASLDFDSVEVADGGSFRMNLTEPENLLVPTNTNESSGGDVLQTLFSTLVDYDQDLNLVNLVAESITSEDSTTWTITLNDWTFHDGTPVTASSFVDAWNFGANAANAQENSTFFASIEGFDLVNPSPPEGSTEVPTVDPTATLSGLTVVDDKTFTVTLASPFPQFPLTLRYYAFAPLPPSFFDDPDAFGEAPIGNGPFTFGEWVHDDSITVNRWDEYPGEPAKAAGIEFVIYLELETAYRDMIDGNLDVMDSIPAEQIANAETDFPGRFLETPNANFTYLGVPLYQFPDSVGGATG